MATSPVTNEKIAGYGRRVQAVLCVPLIATTSNQHRQAFLKVLFGLLYLFRTQTASCALHHSLRISRAALSASRTAPFANPPLNRKSPSSGCNTRSLSLSCFRVLSVLQHQQISSMPFTSVWWQREHIPQSVNAVGHASMFDLYSHYGNIAQQNLTF
jgi:hypothetical protein